MYLSHYLKQNRARYYDLLQNVRLQGDWESWIKFFLEGVAEVANEATETARKIVDMREHHRQSIIDSLGRGAANGLKLLESMYQQPIFRAQDVARLLNLTQQAAYNITDKLEALGLIGEVTGQKRNRVYRYDPYVQLFVD